MGENIYKVSEPSTGNYQK